jgi:hypothetical protein
MAIDPIRRIRSRAHETAIDLDEELIRLAFQSGADVRIVKTANPESAEDISTVPAHGEAVNRSAPAIALNDPGADGALLRYSIW